jgi:glycogen debranching enzyme
MSDDSDRAHESEQDPFYILAAAPSADERSRVLKHADTFAVFDHYGDMRRVGLSEQGLYHEGTRFLSRFVFVLERGRPLFLSSTIKEDNDLLVVDLTNPDIGRAGEVIVPRGTLHFFRIKFLWQGACYERLRMKNYGLCAVETAFSLHFDADFVDIFEVRGARRARRGQLLGGALEEGRVVLAYRGLDGVLRRTRLSFVPVPEKLSASYAQFRIRLEPRQEVNLYVTITCETDRTTSDHGPHEPEALATVRSPLATGFLPFDEALAAAAGTLMQVQSQVCNIQSSKQHFNDWINRTVADLHMMTTQTPFGRYPYAGVPWFSTPFGRDGIITAFECLWIDPSLSRGVLSYLAATQAKEVNPEQDAEPGKILHETRRGEMAALGEIPFGLYYGSVDATPLFVLLAGAYYERTGDRAFVESIWPNVEAALKWIDTFGDCDGDGFVEYARRSSAGLGNQGWKDSHDAIFHADGHLAEGPIALCEVQSYVYGAKRAAAELAAVLGQLERAENLRQQARAMRDRFEKVFWSEDLGTYVLALDGAKRPCRVRTSNAGHCLMTGMVSPERALRVTQTLLGPDSFSGWGIRTLAATEARYNPMSYHNGSIWPHDNALMAYGLARYALKDHVVRIMNAIFDASLFFELHRLPELFCGFERRSDEGPTLYPVACAPQSWSAAAVFLLLQACLGLHVSVPEGRISFSHPKLPAFLEEVYIRNLFVGQAVVDLLLLRHDNNVGIQVLRREGKVEITTVN